MRDDMVRIVKQLKGVLSEMFLFVFRCPASPAFFQRDQGKTKKRSTLCELCASAVKCLTAQVETI